MRSKQIREAISSVVSEFRVADAAVEYFHFSIVDDPTKMARFEFDRSGIRICARRLEITYLLRMFAVFEGGLRDLWLKGIGRKTVPVMERLLDAIAARFYITSDSLRRAHEVRDYRNRVIHSGQQTALIPLAVCERSLSIFLSEIRAQW